MTALRALGVFRSRARVLRAAGLGTASLGLLAAVAAVSSCSAKHDPAGGLLLSVDTNLKVPDDIDTIGISVARATDGGVESEDDLFPLAPNGMAKFPATLTLLRGTDQPLQIRAVGYKDGAAIAMREAVTTLPADHVAVLPLELNWLDKPLVSGTTEETVQSVTSSCGALEGPVAGTCSSFELDSTTLATYTPSAVVPSDGAAAVDCDTCFASGQTVTPDPATCTFSPPAGVTDAASINVAFRLAAGHTAGWCNGGSCIIPLPNDPLEGWSLGTDGLIHLPPAACTSTAVGSIFVVPASADCPVLSSEHPAKQSYGLDGGLATDDAGDATVPDDGDAGDAGVADAGPPATYATFPLTNVVALTTDDGHIYALTSDSKLTTLDLHFATGDTTAGQPLDSTMAFATSDVRLPAAATYPYFAFNFIGVNDSGGLYVVNATTGASKSLMAYETAYALGFTSTGDGGAELSFGGMDGLIWDFVNDDIDSGVAHNVSTDTTTLGANPTPLNGVPQYGIYEVPGPDLRYGPWDAAATVATNVPTQVATIAFPTPNQLAWVDIAQAAYMLDLDAGSTLRMPDSGTGPSSALSFVGGDGWLFYVTRYQASYSTLFGTNVGSSFTAPAAPLAVFPDGGTASSVGEVATSGDQLVWYDGTTVYRRTISALTTP